MSLGGMAAILTLAAALVAMLSPLGAASAQQADRAVVEVSPTAKLLDDSQAVRVKVKVTCEPPAEVLEALVTVHQEDEAAFGEAGITSVVCDGKTRVHRVTVEALDSTFRSGKAFVSAFVLVCLDAQCVDTAQGQDSRLVRLVGS